MNDSTPHLTLLNQNTCYHVSAPLVWGEQWRENSGEYGCDTSTSKTAYNTCSDADMNWYMALNRNQRSAMGVTNKEIKKLQRYSECKAGKTDPLKWCNFLTETIPAGGNYGGDGNPTNDTPQLPNPCLDEDFGGPGFEGTGSYKPCKGIKVEFTGARVKDNNHGWKEIHPVRKETYPDSTGSRTCALDQNNQVSCT